MPFICGYTCFEREFLLLVFGGSGIVNICFSTPQRNI
jgi:hypothetical protein